jgi:nodulation protein E
MTANGSRRVVITGMGAVTPLGLGVDTTWENMKSGKCAVGPITTFDSEGLYIQIAAEVKDFDPKTHLKSRMLQLSDRYSWFAGYAADEAVAQSGLEVPFADPYRTSAIFGSGAGGMTTT